MFNRIMENLRRFMQGRYGMDQLGIATVVVAMVLSLLFGMLHWLWLSLLYWVLLSLCFFRILSRNYEKRYQENQQFLRFWSPLHSRMQRIPGEVSQRKQYVLFKCPHCGQKLRLPRGKGMVAVTCSRCKTEFKKKT